MNVQTVPVFEFQVFGLGTVAQVVTGNGVFGEYFSINVGFGLSVAMGVHVGGKVSGETLLTPKHQIRVHCFP